MGGGGATALPHSLVVWSFSSSSVEGATDKDVGQQPRGGEEAAGEHADGPALPVHGVQEEIPPRQRG